MKVLCLLWRFLFLRKRHPDPELRQLRRLMGRVVQQRLDQQPYCLFTEEPVASAFLAPGGERWARRRGWSAHWDDTLELMVVTNR